MAEKKVYIVTFDGSRPQWAVFNGTEATLTDPPQGRPDLQVVVLLPERFFYYFLPKVHKARRESTVRKAAMLQIKHFFPSLGEGETVGTLPSVQGMMLGFFAKPELAEFMEEHHELFSQANVVTTGFALCWDAATEKRLPCWQWMGDESEQALFVEDEFQYFRGASDELRRRLDLFQLTPDATVQVTLTEALTEIHNSKRRWTRYKLPFKVTRGEGDSVGGYLLPAVVITLVGALFIAGQYVRWNSRDTLTTQWEQRTKELYSQALGPDAGPDPYGKLLYTLDQLNTGSMQGLDVIGLLTAMSETAPESFLVESLSLSADSGSVQGTIGSYDALEKYVASLKDNPEFNFVLEQAANTEDGIKFSFKVAQKQ